MNSFYYIDVIKLKCFQYDTSFVFKIVYEEKGSINPGFSCVL